MMLRSEDPCFLSLQVRTSILIWFHRYVLPHGSYLVNLAQEDPAKAKQAYDCFIDDLRRCEELGIQLYNFQ